MRVRKADRQLLMLLGLAVCVLALWWAFARGADPSVAPPGGATTTSTTTEAVTSPVESGTPRTPDPRPSASTPVSGLATIAESELPPEGRETLELIRSDGPYPYRDDDGIFGNRERVLPAQNRGYYREYTVETPGSDDRGARRIVGGQAGDRYYTDDHYASFRQIEEGR